MNVHEVRLPNTFGPHSDALPLSSLHLLDDEWAAASPRSLLRHTGPAVLTVTAALAWWGAL